MAQPKEEIPSNGNDNEDSGFQVITHPETAATALNPSAADFVSAVPAELHASPTEPSHGLVSSKTAIPSLDQLQQRRQILHKRVYDHPLDVKLAHLRVRKAETMRLRGILATKMAGMASEAAENKPVDAGELAGDGDHEDANQAFMEYLDDLREHLLEQGAGLVPLIQAMEDEIITRQLED